MDMHTKLELDYGNWVRKKQLTFFGVITLALAVLGIFVSNPIARLLIFILALLSFISFLIPFYAYVMFSQRGGKYQQKHYGLILQHTGNDFKGKALDIGTGNGVLAVLLALHHPRAAVTGVDYWGEDWEYSRSVCEKNAQAAGVADRVNFQKGDAAKLAFSDGEFGLVVSNLTFHEVKSVPDKREVMGEALRLVKPGGRFAFIDYFL
jgi:SAM-dependent methyltransferase